MTATTTRRTAGHACDDLCGWATGTPDRCLCACQGRNHGSFHAPAASTPSRMADPFAGMPTTDDQEW